VFAPLLCRTLLVVVVRHTQLAALAAPTPAAPALLAPALLASMPPTATPRVAAVHLSSELSQTRVSKWRDAVASADDALVATLSPHLDRMDPRPVATGFTALARWLEGELVARQQAAAQGSLSMLQMRCDGARMRAEVRAACSAVATLRLCSGRFDSYGPLLERLHRGPM
jgi:hypothetical protein